MIESSKKEKIAILGGGLGSMTTALALTDPDINPDWKDKYEITLYQDGWRLGGKGASGRGQYGRIEEHGLHIWMGFYENSFIAIDKVYQEVQQYTDGCFKTWQDAFKPHNFIVLEEKFGDKWTNWEFNFPPNGELPGDGKELPTLWAYIKMTIGWMHELFKDSKHLQFENEKSKHHHNKIIGWLESIWHDIKIVFEAEELVLGEKLILTLTNLVEKLDDDSSKHEEHHHNLMIKMLEELTQWLTHKMDDEFAKHENARHLYLLLDMGATIIKGLLKDKIMFSNGGFDELDKYDLHEWLEMHGASEMNYKVEKSTLLKGLYDLVFAFRNGEINKPSFAAGAALRSIFRIVWTYKGSVFWKMQAGMGDTIFTPMYVVLKNRGVKFKFFHRVTNLELNSDKDLIDRIKIEKQVNIKEDEYDPLVRVGELDCWPSEPIYDRIKEGDKLKENNIDLESFWTKWENVEKCTLERGKHFDSVVFGISIGSIPYLCKELVDANENWQKMIDNVETVKTLAMQLWLKPDLKELGWMDKSPVIDAFADPFNTWADMSHLKDKEDWPENSKPQNIAYFCGPMLGGIPDKSEKNVQLKENEKIKKAGFDWLEKYSSQYWPTATSKEDPKGLDLNDLVDPKATTATEKYNSQFWHAAVNPSERYVLSVKGSTEHRLAPDKSGFKNLVLTGDWTRNGFNAGCVEATVMSGLLASNAITGFPKKEDIIGLGNP
jgi:uncharacterized protein with NAD-binding domain and iron-sulfur cluster